MIVLQSVLLFILTCVAIFLGILALTKVFGWIVDRPDRFRFRPYACRGQIGHAWRWIDRIRPRGNCFTSSGPTVRCSRCDKLADLGISLDYRAATRRLATFTDGTWIPIEGVVEAWESSEDPDTSTRFGV